MWALYAACSWGWHMRSLLVALLGSASMAMAPGAMAQTGLEPFLKPPQARTPESGISIGVRAGYALPLGSATGVAGDELSKSFSGMIPLQIELGWRFSPQFYAGGFFQYGFTSLASEFKANNGCDQSGVSCSSSDLRFGVDVVFTIAPYATVIPWVGVGAGYELAKLGFSQGGQSVDVTFKGWEFAHVSIGADYRVSPLFRIGPFVSLSFGQFQSFDTNLDQTTNPPTVGPNRTVDVQEKALHEWLQLGIKGTFDL